MKPATQPHETLETARAEHLTLAQIAQRVQDACGEPLACRIETLGEALTRAGFSFKRATATRLKKRDEEEFAMKQATLDKLQVAARDGQCRLFYLDEAAFCASPPVQRSWSPRGLPHAVEPNPHCRRNVLAALNFAENSLVYAASARTVKGPDVVGFLDALIRLGDERPTVIVLDNASIRHSIDEATLKRWFIDHKALLFYLPPYSPELNLIEIVWKHFKYHWRRFVTWTRETIDENWRNCSPDTAQNFKSISREHLTIPTAARNRTSVETSPLDSYSAFKAGNNRSNSRFTTS
ncbi:IS630 family transposase [Paraburkholderia strydomiana]|uniref:IS630 family transposase n=1 Tax=Paraburkholderia strydomiana TaxID=1245417 RepID=A0ABW9CC56_9BURK